MTSDAPAVIDHAQHSPYSDPGQWARLFDDVEPAIASVAAVARNVIAHYRAQSEVLPESSRDDISLRWIEAILATDQSRHRLPLTAERRIADRVQGCCRDHSLLATAALRHHGITARCRVGFAGYLSADSWNHDHVIVEASIDGRWRRFDAEFSTPWNTLSDPTDIARGAGSPFATAAEVWLGHRDGSVDVTKFGVAPGLGLDGDWFVHNYVIIEVAHRFGDELLLWDQWGAMSGDLSRVADTELRQVDELARLLVLSDAGDLDAERELLSRYRADTRWHPTPSIRSYSPYGHVTDVDLVARKPTHAAG